jgi:hypothetical protein
MLSSRWTRSRSGSRLGPYASPRRCLDSCRPHASNREIRAISIHRLARAAAEGAGSLEDREQAHKIGWSCIVVDASVCVVHPIQV